MSYSNTSHVNLYLLQEARVHYHFRIQIHLMLIFIIDAQIEKAVCIIFKYISC